MRRRWSDELHPKEVILGAAVPLENGGTISLSIAGHVETERDYDDAVVIFGRKLLKYTNSATDADRLTVRQVISSITSTPLDKVPDVGTPTPPRASQGACEGRATCGCPDPGDGSSPLQRRSKQRRPSHSASSRPRLHQIPRRVHRRPRKPPRLRRRLHRRKVSASVQSAARPCLRTRRNSRSSSRARRSANNAWRRRDGFENDRPDPPDPRRFY